VKHPGGACGLVALQVADQVPSRVEVCHERLLDLPLLHAIFAKMAHTSAIGLADTLGWKRLRDSNESDFLRPAACTLGGAGDALEDALEVSGN